MQLYKQLFDYKEYFKVKYMFWDPYASMCLFVYMEKGYLFINTLWD